MIDNENEKDILYGTIVYGKDVSVKSKFEDITDKAKVKKFIGALLWKDEGKNLDQALLETDKLFMEHGRPKARKIAVVFVTGEADATTNELKRAAKKLNDNEVKIIVVKLGTEPDDKQLKVITPDENIVRVNESHDAKKSSQFVDDQRMKGKIYVNKSFRLKTYD